MTTTVDTPDTVVLGSGAAGLTAALAAAIGGARVLLLERSPLYGGATAISGGQVWVPNNPQLLAQGHADSAARATGYLRQLTRGQVDFDLLAAFVASAPEMIRFVEANTGLRFFMVERHDYHSEWDGAGYGRSLEPAPFDLAGLGANLAKLRRSPHRPPLTSAELKRGEGAALIAERRSRDIATQGSALVAGLLDACAKHGVRLQTDSRATQLLQADDGRISGVRYQRDGVSQDIAADAVVIATGGFEWNAALKQAFLTSVDEGAASPPFNEGDGLLMALRAGAAVDCMTEAWWSAAFAVPGETYDGRPLVRNIVRELALPGSVLVNDAGQRFVNEASSYNDLGKAFHAFDPGLDRHVNRPAWLVFDAAFKSRYAVATVPAAAPAPAWFRSAPSLAELAERCDIDAAGLQRTVERFNSFARSGADLDFRRGDARHDRYHGDASQPHPNLGAIGEPPFHAIPIFLGNLGTKGGPRTDADGRVLAPAGAAIAGLFACGNAAASWMGPGYPGAGGSLGPIMTAAMRCGSAAAAATARTAHRADRL